MAERKAARPAKADEAERAYYIVNPAGAVHSVTREHARGRLAIVGWRMATADEVTAYQNQEIQRHDRPIARPWTPDPDAHVDLGDETAQ